MSMTTLEFLPQMNNGGNGEDYDELGMWRSKFSGWEEVAGAVVMFNANNL
jgi:hypothetical protein